MDDVLNSLPNEYISQVREYLTGVRFKFDVKIDFSGTDFQNSVWQAMMEIPYGETRTYKQIAEKIGRPKAVRAVGTACGKNILPIIVPCHRVVASGGKLGGYAFGLEAKKQLLDLESKNHGC